MCPEAREMEYLHTVLVMTAGIVNIETKIKLGDNDNGVKEYLKFI